MNKRVVAILGIALLGCLLVGVAFAYSDTTATQPVSAVQTIPDTVQGETQTLANTFATDVVSTSTPTAIDASSAVALATKWHPDQAAQAPQTTVRHVAYTDHALANLSDAALAGQGVKVRPLNESAWVVTFHHVTYRTHGEHAAGAAPPVGNVVLVIDANTGDFVSESDYSLGN